VAQHNDVYSVAKTVYIMFERTSCTYDMKRIRYFTAPTSYNPSRPSAGLKTLQCVDEDVALMFTCIFTLLPHLLALLTLIS
jgi:hypothetical protein